MVEQRTHKPLVASSILAPGTNFLEFTVYLLRGASGRHYIGQTSDLPTRLSQHRAGHTHTTKRLGGGIELVASRSFGSRTEALAVERMLKAWKSPMKAMAYLRSEAGRLSSPDSCRGWSRVQSSPLAPI